MTVVSEPRGARVFGSYIRPNEGCLAPKIIIPLAKPRLLGSFFSESAAFIFPCAQSGPRGVVRGEYFSGSVCLNSFSDLVS